jgi:hypothetical protein
MTISGAGECGHPLPRGARAHARYCSSSCRQAAYRRRLDPDLRPRGARAGRAGQPAGSLRVIPGGAGSAASEQNRALSPATVSSPRSTDRDVIPLHAHSGRLCAVCMTHRHERIRVAPRARASAEILAAAMRREGGDIGPAIDAGYSYRHALRIRAGWRGAGRSGAPVPYTSRGYANGYPTGGSPEALAQLTGRPHERPTHGADVLARIRIATARATDLAVGAHRLLELSRARA